MKKTIHTDGFEGWARRARATVQKLDRGERNCTFPIHHV